MVVMVGVYSKLRLFYLQLLDDFPVGRPEILAGFLNYSQTGIDATLIETRHTQKREDPALIAFGCIRLILTSAIDSQVCWLYLEV